MSAPFHAITPDDRGACIVIVAYILLCSTVCFSALRFTIGYRRRQELSGDDVCYLAALVFAIGQSIAADRAANAGLGRHMAQLSQEGITSYFKAAYAASLIAIVAMFFAKLSVVALFRRLWAPSQHSRSIKILACVTTTWFLFSFLAQAFQCGLSHPWIFNPRTCRAGGDLNYPIIIINALTDAVLALWIIQPFLNASINLRSRITVILLFATRLLVTCSAVVQLAFVTRTIHSSDQTWSNTVPSMLLNITTHLSVITSTIPRIHSFLVDFQTSYMASQITDKDLSRARIGNQINKVKKTALKRSKGLWSWFSNEAQESSNRTPEYVLRRVVIARPERVGAKDSHIENDSTDHPAPAAVAPGSLLDHDQVNAPGP